MNLSKGVLPLLLLTLFLYQAEAKTNFTDPTDPKEVSADEKTKVAKKTVAKRWEANSFSTEATHNKYVKKHVKKFLTKQKVGTELLLGRKSIYFPIFEKYIEELGLPRELKNLPIIESALDPRAESKVGAKGLWQFMPSTGRLYGLTINDYVDERCDPVKSTIAGLTYLKDLYGIYKNWKLAIAAYNCGPGRLNKAMKKSGKTTFEGIKKFLPKETQQYVYKFMAMSYVMENYVFHDLRPIYPEYTLQFCKVVKTHKRVTLKEIAQQTKIDIKTIEKLNPSYRKGIIPPSADGNFIIIPIFGEELTLN